MKAGTKAGVSYLSATDELDPGRGTVLFIHGAGLNGRFWKHQLEHFGGKVNALAIDLPGHGPQGGPGCRELGGYVEAVRGLMDGLGFERFIPVGLSMGGAVTQLFTLAYPQRVPAAVLISTGAKLPVMPEIFETVEKDFELYVKMMGAFACSKSTPQEIITPVEEEIRKLDPKVVYGDFEGCHVFDVRDRLAEIEAPVLIIHGPEDVLTPTKYHDFLKARIARSELVVIEPAAHLVPVEKPEETNRAIETFLVKQGWL